MSGSKFSSDPEAPVYERPPAEPIRIDAKAGSEDEPLLDFYPAPVPLMSKKLLDLFRAARVDNIDAYRADIFLPDGSRVPAECFCVNIVGKIMAADLEKSLYDPGQEDRMIAMEFDSLEVDEKAAGGALVFRLGEAVGTILVHKKVKESVEAAGLPSVVFYPPGEVAI